MGWTRRAFLAGLGTGLGGLCAPARAIGNEHRFRFGMLPLAGTLTPTRALAQLQWQVEKRTAIDVMRGPARATLTADGLRQTPLLYLYGDREFAQPTEAQLASLRRFLQLGGCLFADSAEGALRGGFDASLRTLCKSLFPDRDGLAPLSREHVLFKSFYLVEQPVGRIALSGAVHAVEERGRAVVLYSQNDLAGAWAVDDVGNDLHPCVPGGERQREYAIRLGVNVVMYSMCLDYKTDQVHVPFIMKRRRWGAKR